MSLGRQLWLVLTLLVVSIGVAEGVVRGIPATSLELFRVQLLHRHGAITPDVTYNESKICGAVICEMLTPVGQDMLLTLGQTIRPMYPSLFEDAAYDPEVFRARSTNIFRTLQSAGSFWNGLFPGVVPIISTVQIDRDSLLRASSIPTFVAEKSGFMPELLINVSHYAKDTLFASVAYEAIVQQIAKDFHSEGYCAANQSHEDRGECLITMYDIASAYRSAGTLNSTSPTAAQYMDHLTALMERGNSLRFGYITSIPWRKEMGAIMHPLAERIAQNMLPSSADMARMRFLEYSAHETTIVPLYTALGYNDFLDPPFGYAMLFETYRPRNSTFAAEGGTSAEADQVYVRAQVGRTQLRPMTNRTYTFEPLPLPCMTSNGSFYLSSTEENPDGTCTVGDWMTFLSTSGPWSPLGVCYMYSALRSRIECDSGPPGSPECALFRLNCPENACPSRMTFNYTTQSCYLPAAPTNTESQESGMVSKGGAAAIAIVTFILGAFVALIVSYFANKPKASEDNSQPLSGEETPLTRDSKGRTSAVKPRVGAHELV